MQSQKPLASRNPFSTGGPPARGQFIHVEKYAPRKSASGEGRNIWDIAAEAERVPTACRHVPSPKPGILLHGVAPFAAAKEASAWWRESLTPYNHRNGPTITRRKRKLRRDSPCALVGVVSVPPEMEAGPTWDNFKAKTVAWLIKKYGEDRLKCVFEHVDEPQRHLHFWVVPRLGDVFSTIHQGLLAVEQLGSGVKKALARKGAFAEAMSRYQDEFFSGVAAAFGLMRTSVNGMRGPLQQVGRLKFRAEELKQAVQQGKADAASESADLKMKAERLAEELARESERRVATEALLSDAMAATAAAEALLAETAKQRATLKLAHEHYVRSGPGIDATELSARKVRELQMLAELAAQAKQLDEFRTREAFAAERAATEADLRQRDSLRNPKGSSGDVPFLRDAATSMVPRPRNGA